MLQIGVGDSESSSILSEAGFNVTVLEASQQKLAILKSRLDDKGLSARLIPASPDNLPELPGPFDFAVAYNNLFLTTREALQNRLHELLSRLKEDGFFYITLISTRNSNYAKGSEIEPHTFKDNGEICHYCDTPEIVTLLRHVEIIDLRNQEQKEPGSYHWHILGRNRDPYPPEEAEEASGSEK
ncbi:class I SAM-dependent methyltransferase [candidate division WOR-3 bacterium]|nr:class I SAM-dependent methyltransferase [candidate division WOR-3 bacterium]